MIFTSAAYRRVQERNNFTFDAELSINTSEGLASFGFSGEDKVFKFDFQSGRIIDPEGRYVQSYEKNKTFNLSGNVNDTEYNYYINENLIVQEGKKQSFKTQRMFVDCSGCEFTIFPKVYASGSGDFAFSGFPQFFYKDQLITGKVVNVGSGYAFDILSGDIEEALTGHLAIHELPKNISGNSNIVFSGIRADNRALYKVETLFYTSFGEVNKTFEISGREDNYSTEFSLYSFPQSEASFVNPDTNNVASGGDPFIEKTGSYTLTHYHALNRNYISGIKLDVNLTHHSGTTGLFSGYITGVKIDHGGTGYYGNPYVEIQGSSSKASVNTYVGSGQLTGIDVINPGSGYSSANAVIYSNVSGVIVTTSGQGYTGQPLVNFVGGGGTGASGLLHITGSHSGGIEVSMISYGSGYSSVPSVIFTQQSGTGFVDEFIGASGYAVLATGARVTPLIGTYLKTFTGAWNFYTGSGVYLHQQSAVNDLSGYDNFRKEQNYISGSSNEPYGYENDRIFFKSREDYNESSIDLIVTNNIYYDEEPLVALLTVSGSGNYTTGLYITGIK
tara:strand:- start:679 stop:2355 length:1677 start_codon:yes stop_codon:yes gene_type:complete